MHAVMADGGQGRLGMHRELIVLVQLGMGGHIAWATTLGSEVYMKNRQNDSDSVPVLACPEQWALEFRATRYDSHVAALVTSLPGCRWQDRHCPSRRCPLPITRADAIPCAQLMSLLTRSRRP